MTDRKRTHDRARTIEQFWDAVNMSADGLAAWLETEESQAVGQKVDGGESIGHRSGPAHREAAPEE